MNTIMGILRFGGKASLQLLKTAVSFAAGMVVTFCAFYGLVFLPLIRRIPWLILGTFGVRSLMVAAFAGGFYLTFRLLEPKMAARKKLLVATLGVVLLPASVFALTHKSTMSIAELFPWSSPPGPPKPYEEAIYDVYSDLLSQQEEFFSPPREPVLIQVETLSFQDSAPYEPNGAPPRGLGLEPKEERFKPAVNSAIVDYLKRNEQSSQLQRKFHLSKYDLITKAEKQALDKDDPSACQKYAGYERWVELSVVGFNQDQTVAVVHFIDGWHRPCSNTMVSVQGKDRMLQKLGGKWHLLANSVFSDWTT